MKIILQSSFFFPLGWGGGVKISMCGAEFHANEVCQQCDNLNVFKRRMHKLAAASITAASRTQFLLMI